jgi:hypothetical protein
MRAPGGSGVPPFATPSLGWLKLPKPNVQGGPEIEFGPGTKIWNSQKAAKTTGAAGGGKPTR